MSISTRYRPPINPHSFTAKADMILPLWRQGEAFVTTQNSQDFKPRGALLVRKI
jgi:hypothetical protein